MVESQGVPELELVIRWRDAGGVEVDVLFRPAVGVEATLASAEAATLNPPALIASESDPRTYGALLAGQLFAPPPLRSAWDKVYAIASRERRLRVLLRLSDRAGQLQAIRWERLADPERRVPLVLDASVSIVRLVDSLNLRPTPPPPGPEAQALLVVALPSDLATFRLPSFDIDGEVVRARRALGPQLKTVLASSADEIGEGRRATLQNIRAALQEDHQIVYIVAHGTIVDGKPYLWLERDTGTADQVDAERLARVLVRGPHLPALVVLPSCLSAGDGNGEAAMAALGFGLVQAGLPHVIAMQGRLPTDDLRQLMPALIGQLREGQSIDSAVSYARRTLEEVDRWWLPVQYTRRIVQQAQPEQMQAEERKDGRDRPEITVILSFSRLDDQLTRGRFADLCDEIALRLRTVPEAHITCVSDLRTEDEQLLWRVNQADEEVIVGVPLITNQYFGSEWCQEECKLLLERGSRLKARTPILPVLCQDSTLVQGLPSDNVYNSTAQLKLRLLELETIEWETSWAAWVQGILGFDALDDLAFEIAEFALAQAKAQTAHQRRVAQPVEARIRLEDYYAWFRREEGHVNTFGVRDVGENPRVRDIFVDLRIAPSSPEAVERRLTTQGASAGGQIWSFLRDNSEGAAEAPNLVTVILGGAGFGKTTLLQHIALTFAGGLEREKQIRHYVPLMLYLREHGSALMGERTFPTLSELCASHLTGRGFQVSTAQVERLLRQSRCMVLLDGFDEVPSRAVRERVATWLGQQVRTYPSTRFILTSRPGGYAETPLLLDRKTVLTMLSFSLEQQREFLRRWYLADLTRFDRSDLARERAMPQADAKAGQVLDDLNDRPTLAEFAGNPLLLTMIAVASRDQGLLPRSRIDLYREFYDVLLHRRAQRKGIEERLRSDKKDEILSTLAHFMTVGRHPEVRGEEARALLRPLASRTRLWRHDPDFDLLSYLHLSTNLIVPVGADDWIFAHATFREYATARYLVRGKPAAALPWEEVVKDSWWHETLRFYAAMTDATPIIQACLSIRTTEALTLAVMCLEETSEIDLKVEQALEDLLIRALSGHDRSAQRLGAKVQLNRRLRDPGQWFALDDQRSISASYVSWAEYLLARDFEPGSLPRTASGRTASLLKPALGMKVSEAQDFVAWLNERKEESATGFVYRLPKADEVAERPLRKTQQTLQIATLCQSGAAHTLDEVSQALRERSAHDLQALLAALPGLPGLPGLTALVDTERRLAVQLRWELRTLRQQLRELAQLICSDTSVLALDPRLPYVVWADFSAAQRIVVQILSRRYAQPQPFPDKDQEAQRMLDDTAWLARYRDVSPVGAALPRGLPLIVSSRGITAIPSPGGAALSYGVWRDKALLATTLPALLHGITLELSTRLFCRSLPPHMRQLYDRAVAMALRQAELVARIGRIVAAVAQVDQLSVRCAVEGASTAVDFFAGIKPPRRWPEELQIQHRPLVNSSNSGAYRQAKNSSDVRIVQVMSVKKRSRPQTVLDDISELWQGDGDSWQPRLSKAELRKRGLLRQPRSAPQKTASSGPGLSAGSLLAVDGEPARAPGPSPLLASTQLSADLKRLTQSIVTPLTLGDGEAPLRLMQERAVIKLAIGWLARELATTDLSSSLRSILGELYWQLQVTEAQASGAIVPWGGLRLVRERVTAEIVVE